MKQPQQKVRRIRSKLARPKWTNLVRPEFKEVLITYLSSIQEMRYGDPMTFFRHQLRAMDDKTDRVIPERVLIYDDDLNYVERDHNCFVSMSDWPADSCVSIADRITLACHTWGLSWQDVSEAMGVADEECREWLDGSDLPTEFSRLADVLQVPVIWLYGGEAHNLPSDSPIGFFLGMLGESCRKRLFRMTTKFLNAMPEEFDVETRRQLVLATVMSDRDFSRVARHGGGYWQVGDDEQLSFQYWDPVYRGPIGRDKPGVAEDCPQIAPIYVAWHAITPFNPVIDDGSMFAPNASNPEAISF